MIQAVINWLAMFQHQIKGKNCVMWEFNYKNYSTTFQLPPFNEDYPIETAYGTIYVKILAPKNGDIGAIELSVEEHMLSYFYKETIAKERAVLDLHLYNLSKMAGIKGFTGPIREIPEIKKINVCDLTRQHIERDFWDILWEESSGQIDKDNFVIIGEIPAWIASKNKPSELPAEVPVSKRPTSMHLSIATNATAVISADELTDAAAAASMSGTEAGSMLM